MDHLDLSSALRSLRNGDLSTRLPEGTEAAAEFNALAEQLSEINREITRICREIAVEGRFGGQAYVPRAQGTWSELLDHFNFLAGTMTIQVRTIDLICRARAQGDTDTIATVAASGETRKLLDTLNSIGKEKQAVG